MGAARKLFFIVTIVFLIIKKRTCSVSLCYKGRQLKPAKMQKKLFSAQKLAWKIWNVHFCAWKWGITFCICFFKAAVLQQILNVDHAGILQCPRDVALLCIQFSPLSVVDGCCACVHNSQHTSCFYPFLSDCAASEVNVCCLLHGFLDALIGVILLEFETAFTGRRRRRKRRSDISVAEGPRDALCQLNSCHVLHNFMAWNLANAFGSRVMVKRQPQFLRQPRIFTRATLC